MWRWIVLNALETTEKSDNSIGIFIIFQTETFTSISQHHIHPRAGCIRRAQNGSTLSEWFMRAKHHQIHFIIIVFNGKKSIIKIIYKTMVKQPTLIYATTKWLASESNQNSKNGFEHFDILMLIANHPKSTLSAWMNYCGILCVLKPVNREWI